MTQFSPEQYRRLKLEILGHLFGKLNEMQRSAVYAVKGPVLILAGAGSGKTTVIINRIVNLLRFGSASEEGEVPVLSQEEMDLLEQCARDGSRLEEAADLIAWDRPKPWNVLAITFTNKAAAELRQRLTDALGDDGQEVMAATFHSTCVRILRSEISHLGYQSSFTIYDADDSLRVVKECLAELNLDEKQFPPKTLLGIISSGKDKMLTPEQLGRSGGDNYLMQTAAKVYQQYQSRLKTANAVDFDDLIILTVRLFQQFPEVLEKYQRRWKYIMVDEYQDTNHTQYLLVSLLAGRHQNLCVVGDDDQSIYKFRGATIENILSFENQFKDTKVIRLEQNYRCTSHILDAANHVIANNLSRKGKTLWTDNGEGANIQVFNGTDERREASFIADVIQRDVREGGAYRDHAVLYRMNAQSNVIEQMFIRRGIPYRIVGGQNFFGRKEVKDVLAYLSVINNPADTLRLKRIINEPKRGIGDATLDTVEEIAAMVGQTPFEVIAAARDYAPLSKKAGALVQFASLISELIELAETSSLIDTLDQVLERSGYTDALRAKKDMESQGRLENVEELRTTVIKYMEETEEPSLSGFLEEIALYTDLDSLSPEDDAVVLMTLHSAKGLEFPVVFIAGMEENIFPSSRVLNDPTEIEEERRLAYVGITRAKQRLYLTSAGERMLFGHTTRNRRSRFTGEIPRDIIDLQDETMRSYSFGGGTAAKPMTPGVRSASIPKPASAVPKKDEPFTLKAGDRVRHYKFGDGKILSVTPMGGDHLVQIAFDSGSTKKLMASYIKLEKIG